MTPKGLVLVTGVNGYIGSWIAEAYLAAGYSVRGTVRSVSSAEPLQKLFQERGWSDRFEVVEVKEIVKPGAFDTALQGRVAHHSGFVLQS
jgi:nucleoside-diphosphate-sugar epimerase